MRQRVTLWALTGAMAVAAVTIVATTSPGSLSTPAQQQSGVYEADYEPKTPVVGGQIRVFGRCVAPNGTTAQSAGVSLLPYDGGASIGANLETDGQGRFDDVVPIPLSAVPGRYEIRIHAGFGDTPCEPPGGNGTLLTEDLEIVAGSSTTTTGPTTSTTVRDLPRTG